MRVLVITLLILVGILQYKLWFSGGSVPDVIHLKQTLDAQVQKNQDLQQRNNALEAEVNNLKQGQNAIEERARADLGMINDDETFYQIIDPNDRKP